MANDFCLRGSQSLIHVRKGENVWLLANGFCLGKDALVQVSRIVMALTNKHAAASDHSDHHW